MGITQFAGGTGAELQPLHVVGQREVGSGLRPFLADDSYGEDGKVIQFHVLAVQNQFFGAGNHVCQYSLDDTTRIGGVVIGHVLGQFFDVEGFFDYGACIPEAFQWAVFARHLILFVTNHTIKI